MRRDYGKEIDELREQLARITPGRAAHPSKSEAKQFFKNAGYDVPVDANDLESQQSGAVIAELAASANTHGYAAGIVEMRGLYQSPSGTAYVWDHEMDVAQVLEFDEEVIEKILSAIGDRTRLRMLRTILRSPCTTADLVRALELPTTGKAYHHLNILLSADLILKDDEGIYHVRPHRVAGLVAAQWAAIQTMDSEYSSPDLKKLMADVLSGSR